jgi:hypothetical protein
VESQVPRTIPLHFACVCPPFVFRATQSGVGFTCPFPRKGRGPNLRLRLSLRVDATLLSFTCYGLSKTTAVASSRLIYTPFGMGRTAMVRRTLCTEHIHMSRMKFSRLSVLFIVCCVATPLVHFFPVSSLVDLVKQQRAQRSKKADQSLAAAAAAAAASPILTFVFVSLLCLPFASPVSPPPHRSDVDR